MRTQNFLFDTFWGNTLKKTFALSLALALTSSVVITACSDKTTAPASSTATATTNAEAGKTATPPSSPPKATEPAAKPTTLVKVDVKEGTGAEATAGKTVVVHYTGWLYDEAAANKQGQKFDSSRDRGRPFDFSLGGGRVIPGWEQGVSGMKVGGQRTLIIPPDLAYGAAGAGNAIPPNATLVFDVELLEVK